jgi:hypothetical protein
LSAYATPAAARPEKTVSSAAIPVDETSDSPKGGRKSIFVFEFVFRFFIVYLTTPEPRNGSNAAMSRPRGFSLISLVHGEAAYTGSIGSIYWILRLSIHP